MADGLPAGKDKAAKGQADPGQPPGVEPTVRSAFADTAFWAPEVETDASGKATVSVTWPDNLTTWRMDARAVTQDTRVGQATLDLISTRLLLVRPQTPRFFVAGRRAMAYISSGAPTPIRSRPLRSTWRVARPNARRALRRASGSGSYCRETDSAASSCRCRVALVSS